MINYMLSAVWSLVWHWGTGIGVAVLLFAAAYFSPVYKKQFLYGAIGVLLLLGAYGIGIRDDAALNTAREQAVEQKVENAVKSTQTPAAKKAKDRYDNRKY